MSIFLDTSYLIAVSDKRDINHERAKNIQEKLETLGTVFISGQVFGEIVTFFNAEQGALKARHIGAKIIESDTEIINIDFGLFQKSWQLFNQREKLSFTDCSTIAVMREYGIKNIVTFDSGFNQFKNEINVLPE